MLSTPIIKLIYAKIQKQLFYMIPEKWNKIYLYASIVERINRLQTGELYFYYYPKGILKKNPVNVYEIPSKFNLDEDMYLKLVDDLYNSIKELRKQFEQNNEAVWTSLTIKIEDVKFTVEYNFDNLLHSEYSNSELSLIWAYKNLDKSLESFTKDERKVIQRYLSEDRKQQKETHSEPIYKNHSNNIIQFEKESYIFENEKPDEEKIKLKKQDTHVENTYMKKNNKKIQQKSKTYIEQIEEQQSAIKSQIIAKNIK